MTLNSWWLRKHPGLWATRQHLQGQFALLKTFVHAVRQNDTEVLDKGLVENLATERKTAEALITAAHQIQHPKQKRTALRAASAFYSISANNEAFLPEEVLAREKPADKTIRYVKRAIELYTAGVKPEEQRTSWLAKLSYTHTQVHIARLHCDLAAMYLKFNTGDPTLALEEAIHEYTRALTILEPLTASEFTGYVLAQLGIINLAYPTEDPNEYAERAIEKLERANKILEIHTAKIRALAEMSYSDNSLLVGMMKVAPRILLLIWKPFWRGTPSKLLNLMLMPPSVLMKIHWGLASAYGELGNDAEAMRHFEFALELMPADSNAEEHGMLLLAKSAAYLNSADKAPLDEAAIKLARKCGHDAMEIWDIDAAYALSYPRLVRTLFGPRVADLTERERYLTKTVDGLRMAVQSARFKDLHGAAWNALVLLHRAYQAQANLQRAFQATVLASRIAERIATLARTPRLKLRISREEGPLLELAARAIFDYRRMLTEKGTRIPRHLDSYALGVAERARTRILQDELAQRALMPKGAGSEDLRDFFKLRQRWLRTDLMYVNLQTSETPQIPARMDLVRAQRNAAETRYVRELEAVRDRFGDPDYDPDCPVAPIKSHEVRALVRELSATEDTALVEFFLTDRSLVVFIVFPSGQDTEDLICLDTPMTREELSEIAERWFEGLTQLRGGGMIAQWEIKYFSQTFQRLESVHLAAVEAIAKWETATHRKIMRLILVPHQVLHLLPLHALRLPDSDCWGNCTAIHYAPSASVMWQLHQARARSESAPTRGTAEHTKIVITYSPSPPAINSNEQKQEPLVFARHEAEAVAGALNATVIAGDNATPTRVLAALAHASFIHFACHASFGVDSPMDSWLTLAPSPTRNGDSESYQSEESGFLTLAHLVEQLHFSQSPIVVLSACESGIPKIERYRDEYLGLPLAFLCAGAKTVVSTLWRTNDLAAWILMGDMASHLAQGSDVLRALRLAQEKMRRLTCDDIRGRVERLVEDDPEVRQKMNEETEGTIQASEGSYPFATPYWWAGFTVHGLAAAQIA